MNGPSYFFEDDLLSGVVIWTVVPLNGQNLIRATTGPAFPFDKRASCRYAVQHPPMYWLDYALSLLKRGELKSCTTILNALHELRAEHKFFESF
jgi:hypothetical protein